ncbi:MAG: hypothetical protein MZU95_11390 [Desulfomicrobium escambiense]|nr:hypothetical protein [Desulfomicrobium escambiense]
MRKLIREATFGLTEIEKEEIWRCTTCGKMSPAVPQGCQADRRRDSPAQDGHGIRRLP